MDLEGFVEYPLDFNAEVPDKNRNTVLDCLAEAIEGWLEEQPIRTR